MDVELCESRYEGRIDSDRRAQEKERGKEKIRVRVRDRDRDTILTMKKQTMTKKRESEVVSSEVSSWVNKSRKLEKETSKIFEDDEDTTHYTDHHLAGVKVLHGLDKVAEGGTVILTIKDQPILADHGDVNEEIDMLENVEIREQKRRDDTYKAAKRKTGGLYDDDKFNDDLKYDEEGIILDERGGLKKFEELQRRRRLTGVSTNNNFEDLTSFGKVVSSDYYSHEEMLQFKEKLKKKKKDKLDINSLEAEAISSGFGVGDLGSRKDVKRRAIKVERERLEAEMRNNAYHSAYAKAADEVSKLLADEVKKQEEGRVSVSSPQAIALLVASNHNNNETVVDDQNPKVVFTEMGEFVRGLHIDEEARKLEHEDVFMRDDKETCGWTQVAKETIEEEEPNSEDKEIVRGETIHEVAVGKGLSGALKLLKDRGALKERIECGGGRNMDKKKRKLVGIVDDNGKEAQNNKSTKSPIFLSGKLF